MLYFHFVDNFFFYEKLLVQSIPNYEIMFLLLVLLVPYQKKKKNHCEDQSQESFCEQYKIGVQSYSCACDYTVLQAAFFEETVLPTLNILASLVKY